MPAAKDTGAPVNCPRCARALPPGTAKVCIYCGTPLTVTPTRNPNLGFGGVSSRPQRDPLIGELVAGRFKVEELIGQGGMGKVYRARHLALDRVVCLKMLKPALLEDPTLVGRFEREAKAASRLNHPNGISVLDFGRNDDGGLFIAMEYVQGKDLRIVLRDEWPLPEERLCNIMAQVLSALAEAHVHNVIHRDLKPENIMVEQRRDQPDFVKVLDFGIAKILDSDMPGLTRNDVVCGTPQYMAPEQATGSQLDARCDLYAVGVILYQMATGMLPFDGQNSMEVLTRHVNEPPVPPRQRQPDAPISEAMESLILRALEKDPALRPQNAEEFRQLILKVPQHKPARILSARDGVVTPAHGTTIPGASLPSTVAATAARAAAPQPRRKLVLSAAGVALLVLASGGVFLKTRRRPVVPQPQVVPVSVASPAGSPAAPAAFVQHDPAKARELVLRASEWQAADDTGAARDLLEQATLLDPDNAEAHYRLGGLFLNSQPSRARSEYEAARRLNPSKYADVVDTILKGL
jgi:tRNA A-37 threonylcarbamoyl transferase component Bud32